MFTTDVRENKDNENVSAPLSSKDDGSYLKSERNEGMDPSVRSHEKRRGCFLSFRELLCVCAFLPIGQLPHTYLLTLTIPTIRKQYSAV